MVKRHIRQERRSVRAVIKSLVAVKSNIELRMKNNFNDICGNMRNGKSSTNDLDVSREV